jgi:putative hydrolase of the HAD superfamily
MVDLDLRHLVDVAVVSGLAGVEKPDPAIFLQALDAAGATPEQAIHVGDNVRDDVEGAEAVGIRGILVDRNSARMPMFGPALERQDTIVVASLLDIPDLLGLP